MNLELRINPNCANELPAELTKLQSIGATSRNAVYSPLILNTILLMFYFNQQFGNLFIPMENAPYGGYQLSLLADRASEMPADRIVNEKVNTLIKGFMEKSSNDKIAVSLMFIEPTNAANNHANMILFLNIDGLWHIYHYEPHGPQLAANFSHWVVTGKACIDEILRRLNEEHHTNIQLQYTHLPTRIQQTPLDRIQNISESGYCQMISALQAYLFFKFCKAMPLNPSETTPLGSSIMSPIANGQDANANAEYQLQIIRGFVIFISSEIQNLLSPANINARIDNISQINAYYQGQREITGRYRPLYLYYLDAALKFIINEVSQGSLSLKTCQPDCSNVTAEEIGMSQTEFAELDKKVTPLLGMLNGAIVLTKAAKLKLYSDIRNAGLAEAEEKKASIEGIGKPNKGKIFKKDITIKGKINTRKGGSTRKHKKRQNKRKTRKTRKTRRYRK